MGNLLSLGTQSEERNALESPMSCHTRKLASQVESESAQPLAPHETMSRNQESAIFVIGDMSP